MTDDTQNTAKEQNSIETPGYVPLAGLTREESKEYERILKLTVGELSQEEFDYCQFLNKRIFDELVERCS